MDTTLCKEMARLWHIHCTKMKMKRKIKELDAKFEISVETMNNVTRKMMEEMNTGLQNDHSQIKMLITCFDGTTSPVHPRDDGSRYVYALDLGGTKVRALRFKLSDNGIPDDVEPVAKVLKDVPPEYKIGTLEQLFDFLAETVKDLIEKEENVGVRERELGFCFSFPVTNTAIDAGTLTNWTKDYRLKDGKDRDLVQELRKALIRKGLDIKVGALVNDTVGTLAIGRLNHADCLAGVIFGTGTNAAYIEDVSKINKGGYSGQESKKNEKMVINMEWGNFIPPRELLTEYDHLVDDASQDNNKGKQIFEKMISGKYLGQIVGRILLQLANEPELFGGGVSQEHENKFTNLVTTAVNEMHSDPYMAGEVFEVPNLCRYESKIVAKVCKLVVKRAARLSAAAIVAILTHLGKATMEQHGECEPRPTVIAIDGSLYQQYGKFRKYLKDALEDLLGKDFNSIVTLKAVKDGSGLGAAIIASAACNS